jgi:NTP pyrophosphatase (non-canonical NTP hydrolase)
MLNQLAKEIVRWRKKKGFITGWSNMPEKLMLVVTELSEAMEAYRHGNIENFSEEVGDSIIRILDICGSCDIDIEHEIKKKMETNKTRPRLHGKRC